MSETGPTSEIARKVCDDIFDVFFWGMHPKSDDNFKCTNSKHRTPTDKQKKTHPADVVFYYDDPYLERKTYLHTDMKSYGVSSIKSDSLRDALKSLCLTVECARQSADWRKLYSVPEDEAYEVEGFLFVHNHDKAHVNEFDDALSKISLAALPVAADTVIHFMGPNDVLRLYSIANDIMRLKYLKILPEENYTFYYPDLLLKRRRTDDWKQAATIELLMSPFFVIKHDHTDKNSSGYLIYYNRAGGTVTEFEYLFDSMSRYQMLEHGLTLRIRCCFKNPDGAILSNFTTAKKKYAKAWGFDVRRTALLDSIEFEKIASMADTYTPGDMGWRTDEE